MLQTVSDQVDRLTIRRHPTAWPIMYQPWGKLLFIHWPISADKLRSLIPGRLQIDTYDNTAWIGIVPFTMWGIRSVLMPALPGLNQAHELNVRTYVHLNGVPGVWFFSLDINHSLAVWLARLTYALPYFRAEIDLKQHGARIYYSLIRQPGRGDPNASFQAAWTIGETLPPPTPDSLEFFLVERYCLYSADRRNLFRARIWHAPWVLQRAGLEFINSSMIESHGLAPPVTEPLVHYAEEQHVEIWPISIV